MAYCVRQYAGDGPTFSSADEAPPESGLFLTRASAQSMRGEIDHGKILGTSVEYVLHLLGDPNMRIEDKASHIVSCEYWELLSEKVRPWMHLVAKL